MSVYVEIKKTTRVDLHRNTDVEEEKHGISYMIGCCSMKHMSNNVCGYGWCSQKSNWALA